MEGNDTPRDLVVCCDGTNNTLTGRGADTNVLRLFESLRQDENKNARRILYYDPGVGAPDELPLAGLREQARRKWDRIAGLASGQGVFENIGEAYAFLMRHYRPGDRIWLFGFSRGAFTARSIAGMVRLFGILRPEHRVLLPTLLRVYFADAAPDDASKARSRRNRDDIARQVRETFAQPQAEPFRVWFVGVWDTVESVGMPGMSLSISSKPTIKARDFARHNCIRHARHALALDEHRWPFLPRWYEEDDFGDAAGEQSLRQAWFPGVHSDVGGGYAATESGLADAALHWMVAQANECGLGCPQPPERAAAPMAVVHDPLYDNPWWALVGMTVRASTRVGAGRAGAAPRHSVWDKRRPFGPLVKFAALAAFALLLSGHWLLPGADWPGAVVRLIDPTRWAEAVRAACALPVTLLQGPLALPELLAHTTSGACPRRALLCDFLFIAGYAYVLARLGTRAFARAAGARDVGRPAPALRRLGAALPLLVFGDVAENLCALAGFTLGVDTRFGIACFTVGSLASAAKLVGLVGVVVLLLRGLYPARRTP
ncbi:MAG: DUF2235 domain-containing protein [Planctomycetes bacterium]|nr:DUF2235 domain-containing protein [Planctomycetota bacterium]